MADYTTKTNLYEAVAGLSDIINDVSRRIHETLTPIQQDLTDIKRHLHCHDKELIKLHGTQDVMLDVLLTSDPHLTRTLKN